MVYDIKFFTEEFCVHYIQTIIPFIPAYKFSPIYNFHIFGKWLYACRPQIFLNCFSVYNTLVTRRNQRPCFQHWLLLTNHRVLLTLPDSLRASILEYSWHCRIFCFRIWIEKRAWKTGWLRHVWIGKRQPHRNGHGDLQGASQLSDVRSLS